MVYRALREYFTRRNIYITLRFNFVYLPVAVFLALLILVAVVQYDPSLVTPELYYLLGSLILIPIFGQATELARKRFLRDYDIEIEFTWLNRVIVGVEVAILYGVLNFLTGVIVGGVAGGVSSIIPSQVVVPLLGGGEQNDIVLSLDRLIAFYVFPAAFVFYLHNEKLSDLWPPSQFSPVVVNYRYVSLYLAWSVINYAFVQVMGVSAILVLQSQSISDVTLRIVITLVVIGLTLPIALSLSFYTLGSNAASVTQLIHKSALPNESTQAAITRFE